ncbi:DUF2381 family protein [Corallococcus sicarius]|uniref:DUF2381 family protein n=1 Tax=Corallococcus sicarius TaxID=2316726 RepID=A0A3A8MKR8_9BACT|nr:DUF2381 family protein [Corallococcus sicarius]RKH31889.1 DUF2381 family protein [Corallococcus sicarius]
MPAPCFAVVLALCLLGLPVNAQTPSVSLTASPRPIELAEEPGGESPEVFISPGRSTTLTFDSELLRTAEGKDTVTLEKREAFALVDAGLMTLRLIPSEGSMPGDRLRLTVRFAGRAAPSGAAFTLVVHPVQAEQVVEVYRNARPVESYQQEAREARARTAQCYDELKRTQAERTGPGGLRSLLAAKQLDEEGVLPKVLTEAVTKAPGNVLSVFRVRSYRAAGRVAVEFEVNGLANAPPFAVAGAALTGRRGAELKVLPVWSSGPINADPSNPGHVVVEAEARTEDARGPYTLKLWEEGGGRTVLLGNVTFP